MTYTTTYDTLYENLKNRFTVENDSSECTLGEYMLTKADEDAIVSSLPVAVNDYSEGRGVILSIASYVNDKLTIKKAPVKDKTMRSFPLRTSLASLFSALLICTLVVTYGLVGSADLSSNTETASASYNAQEVENVDDQAPECADELTERY